MWECLRRQASGMGVPVPSGDHGSVRHPDADAGYAWDEGSGTLTVTFTRTPSWMACGAIETRVRQAARACGAS